MAGRHVAERQAVEAVMAASAAGWNAGDVDRFLAVYSDSPETSFVTKDGLMRGKAAMRARYLAHYDFSATAKRGTLSFVTLDFRLLDPTHALYIARYTLTYPGGKTQSGPTSLVFAREATGWHIIADHSS
ncbi:MAG: SgcJ/EcaC family oxidoreductase [Pseudomonadota bacterium]|nr:SgcJ/EcaC family oxidoreductase [Pseudomonadota bacterium]